MVWSLSFAAVNPATPMKEPAPEIVSLVTEEFPEEEEEALDPEYRPELEPPLRYRSPVLRILIFFHPGSRIPHPGFPIQQKLKRGERILNFIWYP
jgi:hypothetical protein